MASGDGYNHVVTIDNRCDKAAACAVSSDVAPEPVQASVPARQQVAVVTLRGSPSPAFKPKLACSLQ